MSPVIKQYLLDNIGKVVTLEEHVLWSLFNELESHPSDYGIDSIDPLGGYKEIGYSSDERWLPMEIGVVLPQGTVVFKMDSYIDDVQLTSDECDHYAPHSEELSWWLYGKYGSGDGLSNNLIRDLERDLLKIGPSLREVGSSVMENLHPRNVVRVDISLGRTVYCLRGYGGWALHLPTTSFVELRKQVKDGDLDKSIGSLVNYIQNTLALPEDARVEINISDVKQGTPPLVYVTHWHGE